MEPQPAEKRGTSAPAARRAATVALLAVIVLSVLGWLGTWPFGPDRPLPHAGSLLITLLGLVAIGALLAWAAARRAPMHAGTTAPVHASVAHPRPRDADAGATEPAALQARRWNLDVLAHIDARRFAAVCETWFSWAGFDTRRESHRTRDGVDIWLHAPRLAGPVAIVRCRLARDRQVGLQELREFQGVVARCKDAHGTFTTTSTYTPEAIAFARDHGIEVVDGQGLLRRILTRTQRSQQALLAVACHDS
ncbi:MAG: restriction endonuclease, partial [Hyphomicrobiales bacterium]|nr:restriction endonuclease [Hyphomicrobiales bacterium]